MRWRRLALPDREAPAAAALASAVIAERPQTLTAMLRRTARERPRAGLIFVDEDELAFTWAEVLHESERFAAGLQEIGARPGERIALVVGGLRRLVTAFFGATLAGLTPTILPTPLSRRRQQAYVDHTVGILRAARVRFVVEDEQVDGAGTALVEALTGLGAPQLVAREQVERDADRFISPDVRGDDIAVVQFTSGSTSAPKGVVLRHEHVMANAWAIVEHLGVRPDDVGGGWLPLYHDMGLIGNLLCACASGISLVMTTPFGFLRRPRHWLDVMERHRVSLTAGPNVSYRYLMEKATAEGRDLSAWRIAIVGAEPIDAELLPRFAEHFASAGFPENGFLPAYGMAEVGLMVTGENPERRPRALRLDRRRLESDGIAAPAGDGAAVAVVSLGRAVRGMEVRVVDEERRPVPERTVGVIEVAGASVMAGYFEAPEATAEVLTDAWLRTGDLGFEDRDELFVTGRLKELIIIDGRNYYPQDIERVVEAIPDVKGQSAIAFSPSDAARPGVVVVACSRDSRRAGDLSAKVRRAVSESAGLPVLDVVLVDNGRIPRTTSGKRCRALCRDQYEAGTLA